MKNYRTTIDTLAALSFLLIYIDGDKIGWFMFMLPIIGLMTLGGAAGGLINVGNDALNDILGGTYLLLVFASAIYLIIRGMKGKPESKLSIAACLLMFSFVLVMMNKDNFYNITSIIGLTIFIGFCSLSVIQNYKGLKRI